MKVAIDTSSLISLVRYYLPFDNNNVLYNLFKEKIESKEIIILDKVFDECEYTSQGIVVSTLEFLKETKNKTKTIDLLPNKTFFNLLENQFINPIAKRLLTSAQLEVQKDEYLESADAKLLLYSMKIKKESSGLIIVSEETITNNDRKPFRKIPAICKIVDLQVMTLPELLSQYEEISFEFN